MTGQPPPRAPGDDVTVSVRVRRANLPALEAGVQLGIDHLTGKPIELRLVHRDDGTYDLQVITNLPVMHSAPDPVSPEMLP